MLGSDFYTSAAWRHLRELALARDGSACTVARLLGGSCSDTLHVHHIEAPDGPDDPRALALDNLGTACSAHHPRWEALRRALVRSRDRASGRVRCPHRHVHAEARRACEARLARAAG